MEHPAAPEVVYWLDAADRILRVSPGWDVFARANGGEALLGEAVLGQPLRRFVSGDPTRMWLDAVLSLARLKGAAVERAYRCDCPDMKRFMRMQVVPEPGGVLRLEHRILSVEPREPVHFVPWRGGQGRPVARCSLCCRIQQDGQWTEAAPCSEAYPVIYTVCPECRESAGRAVARAK